LKNVLRAQAAKALILLAGNNQGRKMKNWTLILIAVAALNGCKEEEKVAVEPEVIEDCLAITNLNDRELCKMTFSEKMKKKKN
jgi:hypothetical protein